MKTQSFSLSCLFLLVSIPQLHAMNYNPSKTDEWFLNPEETAEETPSETIQASLPLFNFENDTKYKTLLEQAQKNGDQQEIKALMNDIYMGYDEPILSHITAIKKTPLGLLPLETAIRSGHRAIVKKLIPYADDTEAKEAFIIAIATKQLDIAFYLKENTKFTLNDADKVKIVSSGCADEALLDFIFLKEKRDSYYHRGSRIFVGHFSFDVFEAKNRSCYEDRANYMIDDPDAPKTIYNFNSWHRPLDKAPEHIKDTYREKSPLYAAISSDNTGAIRFLISQGAGLLGTKEILLEAAKNPETKKLVLEEIRTQEKEIEEYAEKQNNLLCGVKSCTIQ